MPGSSWAGHHPRGDQVYFAIVMMSMVLAGWMPITVSATTPPQALAVSQTAKAKRDAEKILMAVSSWTKRGSIDFNDHGAKTQLFALTSKAKRLASALAILHVKEPIPFLTQYESFVTSLTELHKAVVLKSEWVSLLEGATNTSRSALAALREPMPHAGSMGTEIDRLVHLAEGPEDGQ
ncbi:MAG: hypothetical protein ACO3CV_02185 [Steroidobacteraceae bacterium]